MGIKIDEYDKICVIEVDGDLSAENARMASMALEEKCQQRKVVNYVVDMGKCSFVDSEGLEALLTMKRRCEDMFGQIKLARIDENCRIILQITRLDHRFESYSDLPQALKTMR